MPRLLPEPDMTKFEYVEVRVLGTAGPSQDHVMRVLRKKATP